MGRSLTAAPQSGPAADVPVLRRPKDGQYFNVFAVIATTALRRSGESDLVAAELAKLPGVRVVEREQLDAAMKELTAGQLLGPDSIEGRLDLGRLVKANALVIIAEADQAGVAFTTSTGRAVARVVISDCSTGARLFEGLAATGAPRQAQDPQQPESPADLPSVVADAVAAMRQRYPAGVRWVIGTSPFLNLGLSHDYDSFQDRFAALLNNTLSIQPGVAVLEIDEARLVGKEQQIGDGALKGPGTRDPADGVRIVPLIINGDYRVTQTHVPSTAPSRPTGFPGAGVELSVEFSVSLTDGKGPVQQLHKTVGLTEAPAFLTRELPDAVMAASHLSERKPLDDLAQLEALVRRAESFSRLGAFEESIPLREAALLLRPTDPTQHRRLTDEYQRVGVNLAAPGDKLPQLTPAARERRLALEDSRCQAGLEHLEYLIRNRLIDRPGAIETSLRYRTHFPAAIPDGPPYLRQFFTEVYPIVLSLKPGGPANPEPATSGAGMATQQVRPVTPDEIDQIEKIAWLDAFFGQAAHESPDGPRLSFTSSGGNPAILDDDSADLLADMIARYFPDDVFLPADAGWIFERVPGSEQSPNPPTPRGEGVSPSSQPAAPAAPDHGQIATYARFLDRVEKTGKAPYPFWVRLSRLRMEWVTRHSAGAAPTGLSEFATKLDVLEHDYCNLQFHGNRPGPADPLRLAIARLRARTIGDRPNPTAPYVQVGVPTTQPSPDGPTVFGQTPVDKGTRLWFLPLSVRVKSIDGKDPGARRGLDGAPAEEQLFSAGPALDVIWSARHILFWKDPGLIQEVFDLTTAADAGLEQESGTSNVERPAARSRQGAITDVKWDGQNVWVAYALFADGAHPEAATGLAVLDADGKTIRRIGKDEGLPSGEQGLLIHPISEGRVVAVGSFGGTWRGWCARVTAGKSGERPQVQVFHTAVAVENNLGAIDSKQREPDAGADMAFRPTWLAECRPPAAPGSPASPRLLLVGRALFLKRRPLVIDLDSLTVSVAANPLTHDDRQAATQAVTVVADGFWEVHNSCLYRYQLSWNGSQLSGTSMPVFAGTPLCGPFQHILSAGDSIFLPGNRTASDNCWFRYDIKSREVERLEPDYLTARDGPCTAFGYSARFGLVGWGHSFCRVILTRDRPAGALHRQLFAGPLGVQARFEPDGSPSVAVGPAAVALSPELAEPTPREPTLDEMIAQLDVHQPGLGRTLSRLAEMKPEKVTSEKRQEVSDDLVPLVLMANAYVQEPAMRAFAVWHAPESEVQLLAKLKESDTGTRRRAVQAIGTYKDPTTIPDVVRQFPKDRNAVVGCLVAIGPAAEPAVLAILADVKSTNIEVGVIDALAIVGTPRSVPALQAILERHPDRQTAEVARQALEMIQKRQ